MKNKRNKNSETNFVDINKDVHGPFQDSIEILKWKSYLWTMVLGEETMENDFELLAIA